MGIISAQLWESSRHYMRVLSIGYATTIRQLTTVYADCRFQYANCTQRLHLLRELSTLERGSNMRIINSIRHMHTINTTYRLSRLDMRMISAEYAKYQGNMLYANYLSASCQLSRRLISVRWV